MSKVMFRFIAGPSLRPSFPWAAPGLGAGVLLALLAAGPARSQTLDQVLPPDQAGTATEPDVTVRSRLRPGYDALGIRAGAFLIRPSADQGLGYESNVLGTSTPKGSPVVDTSAALVATTDQSRGAGTASLSVHDLRYTDQPSQSHTDWTARLSGSYDLGRDVLAVDYAHLNLAETLRDLGVASTLTQALPYRVDDGRVSYRSEFARLFVVPALEVVNYDYDNIVTGGTTYTQSYRNHVAVQPSATLGYELSPRRNVVVVVRGGTASYSSNLAGFARRDYTEASVLGGIDYDVTGLLRVRALVGYQTRSFQSSQYKNVNAPILEGSLSWNPTGLTTVTGTVSRSIQDSADVNQSAVTETFARLRIDHEYYRNVILQANASFAVDEYPGSTSQTLYGVGAGATYLVNRNMSVGATYDFTRRSTGALNLNIGATGQTVGPGYSDNLVQLRLRVGL